MKGWIDRVLSQGFAFSLEKMYDNGIFKVCFSREHQIIRRMQQITQPTPLISVWIYLFNLHLGGTVRWCAHVSEIKSKRQQRNFCTYVRKLLENLVLLKIKSFSLWTCYGLVIQLYVIFPLRIKKPCCRSRPEQLRRSFSLTASTETSTSPCGLCRWDTREINSK